MNVDLPIRVRQRIARIFSAVPHVSAEVRCHVTTQGLATLSIHVDGWGPALQRTTQKRVQTYPGERVMIDGAPDFAIELADEQAMLVRIASTFGIDQPMDRGPLPRDQRRMLTAVDTGLVSHMHIERLLADVLVTEHGPMAAAERIIHCLDALESITPIGGLRMYSQGNDLFVKGGQIIIQPWHLIGGPTDANLSGRILELRTRIPETMLMATLGRPLGTLVETGIASLDAAMLESSYAFTADGLQLITPSNLVRIRDHAGLAVGLAATIEDPSRPRAPR